MLERTVKVEKRIFFFFFSLLLLFFLLSALLSAQSSVSPPCGAFITGHKRGANDVQAAVRTKLYLSAEYERVSTA